MGGGSLICKKLISLLFWMKTSCFNFFFVKAPFVVKKKNGSPNIIEGLKNNCYKTFISFTAVRPNALT